MVMNGFSANEDKVEAGKLQSVKCVHDHQHHRRWKSTSGRNLDVSRGSVLRTINRHDETKVLPPSPRAYDPINPLHRDRTHINKSSSSHRASLEKDIEQLQVHLQQEKSMRIMLEKAMGRVSSTLSPGHRHFAGQTKELIAEIELLEEEVVNREQHVLSLYRSIFEHCVSRPTSQQSSGMTSPAHTKHESRKHPSVISNSFCSSKNFALRPLQALVFTHNFGKRTTRTSHASLPHGKVNVVWENTRFGNYKDIHEKTSAVGKSSCLRTLKDHLYQCPSRLSEEMVKCMAAVYNWISSTTSVDPIPGNENTAPLLRSSTKVTVPKCLVAEKMESSSKPTIEISWIRKDKHQSSHASYAIGIYRLLVEQLERVNISQLGKEAQIAFWINVYNSLIMHAYLAYGIPSSSIRRLALFHKAAYNIGGHTISANIIEHSIFSFHTPRIGRWFETILSTAMRKKTGEERQKISSIFGPRIAETRVCFALCTGATTDPVLRVYTAAHVEEELERAKQDFLQANVTVKKSRKVFLPKIFERYAREASMSTSDLLKWVSENVELNIQDSIQKCIDQKTNWKTSQVIEWMPYNSKFRYEISKELTEKPWWL